MPDLPDVPSIYDYAKTNEQRQLMRFVFSSTEFGRPYLFPPEVPKDRVEFMRKAIAEAVKDPELVAEAARMKLDMTYRPPEHLEQLVTHLYETPPALIETDQEDQSQRAVAADNFAESRRLLLRPLPLRERASPNVQQARLGEGWLPDPSPNLFL